MLQFHAISHMKDTQYLPPHQYFMYCKNTRNKKKNYVAECEGC